VIAAEWLVVASLYTDRMSTSSSKLSVTQDIDLPKLWIKPYYASFDGLRAVAVSLVFLCHYASFYRRDRLLFGLWGWVGVDLFFVLSGFLITGILYDSLHRPNYFRNFYVRRALRIFPIFYGFFLLLFLLTPALHLKWQWSVLSYFFYVGNLIVPFCDLRTNNPTLIMQAMPDHTLRYFCNIGYLWSLCVEEQFYLVWPAVIYFVRDRKTLLKICVGLIATTVIVRSAFRIHLDATINQHWLLFYWSTYFHSDGLLIGAFLALWLRTQKLSLRVLRRLSLWLFLVPAAIFFPGFLWTQFAHWDVYFLQNAFMNTVG
jgi:peptidoglycan/LPS O-acetylase OafA/YrhL